MHDSRTKQLIFRIGTLARLSGISMDRLRVWQRRYSAVKPMCTAGGRREYTGDERLQLIKQQVDRWGLRLAASQGWKRLNCCNA
jgi:DNA-binding transcriptional MerR regulator